MTFNAYSANGSAVNIIWDSGVAWTDIDAINGELIPTFNSTNPIETGGSYYVHSDQYGAYGPTTSVRSLVWLIPTGESAAAYRTVASSGTANYPQRITFKGRLLTTVTWTADHANGVDTPADVELTAGDYLFPYHINGGFLVFDWTESLTYK